MVIFCIRIQPVADRRAEAIELFRSVLGPISALPGCTELSICEEQGAEHAIVFNERWEAEGDFDDHVRSPLFSRILAAIELSSIDPRVEIHRVQRTEGLNLIHALRGIPTEAPSTDPRL